MSRRAETIIEEQRPGFTRASVYVVDDRIIIDEYDPKFPDIVWFCDHCDAGNPVTAQFKIPGDPAEEKPQYITLCRACLQLAINGIDLSLVKPRTES